MALNLFHGKGALTQEEWNTLWKGYEQFRNIDFQTDLPELKEGRLKEAIKGMTSGLSNLAERLMLTVAESREGRVVSLSHSNDCGIYLKLVSKAPQAGICTCGYGLRSSREGNATQLYSEELIKHIQSLNLSRGLG